jgi:hypothetical protein
MQRRNLVMGLALGILFTAGCATQTAPSETMKQREINPPEIKVLQDFRKTDAIVKISVACAGQSSSSCTPYPSGFIVGVDKTQNIVFPLVTASYMFENIGIQFADNSYSCTRNSDTQYTCYPNNPSSLLHKYTIRVVGTTPNDPFVFTY